MRCSFCNAPDTKVTDSRLISDGATVRRRRECNECHKRFTTYERLEIQMPVVVKNDGRREQYNRQKILSGINKACQKRTIATQQIEILINSIEKAINDKHEKEVPSRAIGEIIMNKLLQLDPVAYVRFASNYWNFKDIDDFVEGLKTSRRTTT